MKEQTGEIICIDEKLLGYTLDKLVQLLESAPKDTLDAELIAKGVIKQGDETGYLPLQHTSYKISRGSAYELLSQALVSEGLKYVDGNITGDIKSRCKIIIDELDSLIKAIENPLPQPQS